MKPSSTSRLLGAAAALLIAGGAAHAQPYLVLPGPPTPVPPFPNPPWIPSLHIYEAFPVGIPLPPSPNILLQLRDLAPGTLYGAAQMGVASQPGMYSAIASSFTLPPYPVGRRSDVVYNAEDAEDLIFANLSGTPTFDADKGAIRFSTTPAGAVGFPADVERMTILSNGNVGIGKTKPQTTTWIEGMPVTTIPTVCYGSILEIYDAQGAVSLPSYGGIGFGSLPGVDFSIGKKTVSGSETYFQIRAQNGTEFVTVDQTGNTGIGSNDPIAKLEVKDGNVVFGGSGGGALNLGGGTRMMWLQQKGAFRAGATYTTEWDDPNVGDFSVAMGLATKASGNYSTAIGNNVEATSSYSMALGSNAHATGHSSIAIGNSITAQAYRSTVFGAGNVVAGTSSSWVATDPLLVVGNSNGGGASNALTILKNGNVEVGTHTAPPLNALDVAGGAVIGSSVAGSVTAPADGLVVVGKVGLNTSTPQNQLDVGGAAVFGSAYAGTVSAIANSVLVEGEVGIGYTTNPGTYKLYVNGRSYYHDHAFYNGEVGIGYTTNPGSYRLYVNGTSYFNGNTVYNGNGNYSGELGVGYTTNPGVYKLYVNGDAYFNGSGTYTGTWTSSDAKWKRNVAPIGDALAKVMSLHGVSYDWKQDEFPEINFPKGHQIGFIAQDVEKVVPEVVHTDAKGDKSLAYQNLTALLAEAIKEQQGAISRITTQATDLKADNAKLSADNQALRAQVDEQALRISRLEQAIQKIADNAQSKQSLGTASSTSKEAQLFQNDPNPFSESTSIGYYLPPTVNHAELIVYSAATGKEMTRQTIIGTGNGKVVVNGRDLGSGTYYYTMLADGTTVHGKTMIVVK